MAPKWILPAMVVLLIVMVVSGVLARLLAPRQAATREFLAAQEAERLADPLAPTPPLDEVEMVFPVAALTDQDGRSRTTEILNGQITLVSFIFTNCVLVCPQLTGVMAELHEATEGVRHGGRPIRQLSISVDPERDTPEVLRSYAESFGADTERWVFTRTDQAQVDALAETLMFRIAPDPDPANLILLPDGSEMANIVHPSRVFLVGPDRRVLGLYDSNHPQEIDRLKQRLQAIARAP
ncbi:MAG: SCO family protein [Phycisphaerales bacterium]|nr:MAG: SCO family protein [Phycisphaerales bacterium]